MVSATLLALMLVDVLALLASSSRSLYVCDKNHRVW
jgi:hypothetical protein